MATEVEIAWAAGLFEGEGCARVRRDARRSKDFPTPAAALGMTDEEPVRRFHEIVGFGHVRLYERHLNDPNRRQLWRWESSSKTDLPFLASFLPYLSPRRREAVEAMIAVCVLADRTEINRRTVAGLTKTHYCECGRGPFYPGPLGKHRKACATVRT